MISNDHILHDQFLVDLQMHTVNHTQIHISSFLHIQRNWRYPNHQTPLKKHAANDLAKHVPNQEYTDFSEPLTKLYVDNHSLFHSKTEADLQTASPQMSKPS